MGSHDPSQSVGPQNTSPLSMLEAELINTVMRAVQVGSHQQRQMAAGSFTYLIDTLHGRGHRCGGGKDVTWHGGHGMAWWVWCGVVGVAWHGGCDVV
jgi:hypothetical protein